MKKLSILLLTVALTVTLTGCGNVDLKEDIVETKTCTMTDSATNLQQTFNLFATNNEINKVELTMVYNSEDLGLDTSTFTEDQKEQFKTTILQTLGLDSTSYEGIEVIIEIEEELVVTLKADLATADEEILRKIGLDFSNADMSFDRAVADLKDRGAVCE